MKASVSASASKASSAFTAFNASSASSKLLIITYYWPPCGGAGVQRWLKFSKYLPEYGWQPIVLTVDPEYAEFPARDESLLNDIRPEVKVFKTRAINYFRFGSRKGIINPSAGFAKGRNGLKSKIARFIRGNFFIPDPRKGWNKYAIKKAAEIIKSENIKYIVTTSPPHSTQLIGLKLKKLFPDIKWICDLRDPWTDIYYYNRFYSTLPARIKDKALESKVLDVADIITSVGSNLAALFKSKTSNLKEVNILYNGYDEEDFSNITISPPEKFTITYVGTLSDQYPYQTILKALSIMQDKGYEFVLNLMGQFSPLFLGDLRMLLENDKIRLSSYGSHREALKSMSGSSVLLILIPDHEMNNTIITGKLFEYLRTGLPVLLIGPTEGDAARIISESQAGKSITPGDYLNVEKFLSSQIHNSFNYKVPSKYSRRNLTEQFIEILLRNNKY